MNVNLFVTRGAKGDQVAFDIVAESASRIDVMHLQGREASAGLTAPSIALQDLPTKPAVCFRI
jgi:hypothetical protein